MTPFERQLRSALGFHELGLHQDAWSDLETLGADARGNCDVLGLKVAVLQSLERWPEMESTAREYCDLRPDESQGFISLAYATRRARSLELALEILSEAQEKFPLEAIISYNLACYHAQLGALERARTFLHRAIAMDSECRRLALADPDLIALRGEL